MLRKVVRGSILTGLGIGVLSVFEYLYLIYTGNVLPPDEFGRLNTVIALLTILLGVATVGLGTSVAKFVAAQETSDSQGQYISSSLILELIVAAAVTGVLVLATLLLKDTRLNDMRSLLLMLAALFPVLALATFLPFGFLGLERMLSYNTAMVISVGFRILVVPPLVYFLPTAEQAFLAFLVGGSAAVVFCLAGLRGYVRGGWVRSDLARELFKYSLPVTVSSFLVIAFVRSDVVFLKALLNEESNLIVARYSAVAALARGVFYLSSAVAVALLPAVSKAGRMPSAAIWRLVVALSAGFLAAIVLARVFGAALVGWLFPRELEALSYLLPYIVVAMAVLSLAHLVGTVLIAVGRPGASALAFALGFAVFTVGSLVLVPVRLIWAGGIVETLGLGADGLVIALAAGAGVALVAALALLIRVRAVPLKESLDWSSTLMPMIDGGP